MFKALKGDLPDHIRISVEMMRGSAQAAHSGASLKGLGSPNKNRYAPEYYDRKIKETATNLALWQRVTDGEYYDAKALLSPLAEEQLNREQSSTERIFMAHARPGDPPRVFRIQVSPLFWAGFARLPQCEPSATLFEFSFSFPGLRLDLKAKNLTHQFENPFSPTPTPGLEAEDAWGAYYTSSGGCFLPPDLTLAQRSIYRGLRNSGVPLSQMSEVLAETLRPVRPARGMGF